MISYLNGIINFLYDHTSINESLQPKILIYYNFIKTIFIVIILLIFFLYLIHIFMDIYIIVIILKVLKKK